ncbi:bifunctional lysylphosphatidylglycerol flippase/synthetase MprF [Clavibacter tessellarius]|uniref:bifunctional lysylphosphatidylglycerol flippase/synthetase MprF n=1 Tax=Clavibacter tessellarius TaxID=31965 RepID=UPI0039E7B795
MSARPRILTVRGAARALAARLLAQPVTLGIAAVILLLGVLPAVSDHWAHVIHHDLATGYVPVVERGHWWTTATAAFLTDGPVELVVSLLAVLVLVGAAERLMGWWRTLLGFVLTGTVGSLLGIAVQAQGLVDGELWSHGVRGIATADPLTAVAGVLALSSAWAGVLWRRRIRVVLAVVVLVFLLYSGQPSDLYRLLAIIAGGVAGGLLHRPAGGARWQRSSHHEVRVILAAVVGILGTGPAIALLSRSRYGPLAPIALLFVDDRVPGDAISTRCLSSDFTHDCLQEIMLARIGGGVGPILLSVAPLLALLVAAYGLARGRRFAVWLAVAVNALLAVLSAYAFGMLVHRDMVSPRLSASPSAHPEAVAALVASVLLPLGSAIVLVLMRRHFTILSTAPAIRRFLFTVGAALAGLMALFVGVGLALADGFTRTVDLNDLVAEAPDRFIPASFLRGESLDFLPTDPITDVVYRGVGPVFWIILVIASLRAIADVRMAAVPRAASLVRPALERGAIGSLSHMATWPGNSYWIAADGATVVAYRVVGSVAITTAAPFGAPADDERALRDVLGQFARYADDNGWTPVFYSVPATLTPIFRDMGWETLVVAEETVVRPGTWQTTGKKWQDVRTSINRADRAGIRAEWTTWGELPLAWASQIDQMSEEWVAEKELPEMGFTLGGVEELRDPQVRLMLAVDADDRVQAATSWLPTWRDGQVVGWTLDFMRRRPDGINGVMEFLIARSAMRMKEDGIEFMSLSAAPLAQTRAASSAGESDAPGEEPRESAVERILEFLADSLEPVYGFRSLLEFKRKFQPELVPLIMAYPDATALPTIGLALTRAYLPSTSVRDLTRVLRSAR